ncbi:hypothetical protein GQ42DRAFT_177668 [Ramicandelaber brevisporus]|nr:hypothetical protein GQ42DRAFT_177668 [Ramicandelaber brevisporus]
MSQKGTSPTPPASTTQSPHPAVGSLRQGSSGGGNNNEASGILSTIRNSAASSGGGQGNFQLARFLDGKRQTLLTAAASYNGTDEDIKANGTALDQISVSESPVGHAFLLWANSMLISRQATATLGAYGHNTLSHAVNFFRSVSPKDLVHCASIASDVALVLFNNLQESIVMASKSAKNVVAGGSGATSTAAGGSTAAADASARVSIFIRQAMALAAAIAQYLIRHHAQNEHARVITPLHVTGLKLTLLGKRIRDFLPILRLDLAGYQPDDGNQLPIISDEDLQLGRDGSGMVLQYLYFAGQAYIQLKMYREALDVLSLTLCVPGRIPSAIQVAAYRKITILSLLVTGRRNIPPKYLTSEFKNQLNANVQLYARYANLWESLNLQSLEIAYQTSIGRFSADGNLQIIEDSLLSQPRQKIARLTQTYVVMSLPVLGAEAGLDSRTTSGTCSLVECALLGMIESGKVTAKIQGSSIDSREPATVIFQDQLLGFDTPEELAKLEAAIASSAAIFKRLTQLDKEIEMSEYYHDSVTKLYNDAHPQQQSFNQGGYSAGGGLDFDYGGMGGDMLMD